VLLEQRLSIKVGDMRVYAQTKTGIAVEGVLAAGHQTRVAQFLDVGHANVIASGAANLWGAGN